MSKSHRESKSSKAIKPTAMTEIENEIDFTTTTLDWIFYPIRHGIFSVVPPVHRETMCYLVASYPENQNPSRLLFLQRKLDEMSPSKFLNFVLLELSLKEKESMLVDEKFRRKSFLVNWPHNNNLSGVNMAQAGFYCLDYDDRVQCVFCREILFNWEPEDNPMTGHANLCPLCPFVQGLECGNKEYRNYTPHAAVIQYSCKVARKDTYQKWLTTNALLPEPLCEAGFYYTGVGDQVSCFDCSGSLSEWSAQDDPWEEHARWFPYCTFLLEKKGENYVKEVREKVTDEQKKYTYKTTLQVKVQQLKGKTKSTTQQVTLETCINLEDQWSAITCCGKKYYHMNQILGAALQIGSEEDRGIGITEGHQETGPASSPQDEHQEPSTSPPTALPPTDNPVGEQSDGSPTTAPPPTDNPVGERHDGYSTTAPPPTDNPVGEQPDASAISARATCPRPVMVVHPTFVQPPNNPVTMQAVQETGEHMHARQGSNSSTEN